MEILEIADARVLHLGDDDPMITRPDRANVLIGDASGHEPSVLAQKLVNYRFTFAVIGDISGYLEASSALRNYVWESNRGGHVWFLADRAELEDKLTARSR